MSENLTSKIKKLWNNIWSAERRAIISEPVNAPTILKDIIEPHEAKYPTKISMVTQELSYLPKEIDPAGIIKTDGGVASVIATKFEEFYNAGYDITLVIPEYYDMFRRKSNLSDKEFEEALSLVAINPHVKLVNDGLFRHADRIYDDESYALSRMAVRRAIHLSKAIISISIDSNRNFPKSEKISQLNEWGTALAAPAIKKYDILDMTKVEQVWHNVYTVERPLYKLNQHGFNTQRYHKDLFYTNGFPSDDHGKDMYRLVVDFLSTGLLAADRITSVGTEIVQKVLNGDLVRLGAMSEKMREMIRDRVKKGESEIVPNEPSRTADPELSPLLKIKYGTKDIMEGKARNKLEVQRLMQLEENPDSPMFLLSYRFQRLNKRADIALGVLEDVIHYYATAHDERPQFVIVADGEPDLISWAYNLQSKYPKQLSVNPFNIELEELVLAGADYNISTSGWENRGRLNILGPRYGNWPIVPLGVEGVHSFDKNQEKGNGWRYEYLNGDGLKYGINEAMKFQRQSFGYRKQHIQRAREQNLVEHSVDNMISKQLGVWERMLDHELIKK